MRYYVSWKTTDYYRKDSLKLLLVVCRRVEPFRSYTRFRLTADRQKFGETRGFPRQKILGAG